MQSISLGFFTHPQNNAAIAELLRAFEVASNLGFSCYIDPSIKDKVENPLSDIPEAGLNFVVAFGGDGTILRAVPLSCRYNAPILGVNLGRLGFLSEILPADIQNALLQIASDDFTLDSRMMLACRVNGGETRFCLNEALLYKRQFSGVADISMEIDGVDAGKLICDGLIVSTPTGSTAYAMSAGGPIIAHGLDAAVITPICPHSLSSRPIVVAKDMAMRFTMNSDGYIALDGDHASELSKGDEVEIFSAANRVDFVRFKRMNLFSLIRDKLS